LILDEISTHLLQRLDIPGGEVDADMDGGLLSRRLVRLVSRLHKEKIVI